MMRKKLNAKIQATIMSGLIVFLLACNNSDYTKSPSNESASNDTTMNNNPNAAKSSAETEMKKKGKVTVGSMTDKGTTGMKADKTGVYSVAEVMPAYPGGHNALEDYVNNTIEYPQTAIDNHSEGTVNVQFVVDENGNVTNAKVVGKGLGSGLDEEAVKVVSGMPKWTAGKVKGENVKTRMILPVTYKLEG